MSMNLHVHMVGGPGLDLWQTPTEVTYQILKRHASWQEQAQAYLLWVKEQLARDLESKNPFLHEQAKTSLKQQRKAVGKLWALADQKKSRLVFYAS